MNSQHPSYLELLRSDGSFYIESKKNPILEGTIVSMTKDTIFVDVGLKMNVKFKRSEFFPTLLNPVTNWSVGDKVQLLLESFDMFDNNVVLSYEKAQRLLKEKAIWDHVEKKKYVNGRILNAVHGGYSVGIGGIVAFLPKNHLGEHHEKMLGQLKTFSVIKANRETNNVIVSRLSALEAWKKKKRQAPSRF